MKTSLDCIPCFVRQALDVTRQVTDDESLIEEALREILRAASEFDYSLTPPEMGQVIHKILRATINNPDPYRATKLQSTTWALRYADRVRERIGRSPWPFESALRFAIAGNIMDFAITSSWDDRRVDDSFGKALEQTLDRDTVGRLEREIDSAGTVLVLGDNAGETVFDRLLIEQFADSVEVTYAAKSGPVINDATLEDAREAGLDQVSRLIGNGTDAPGTVLSKVSPEFKEHYNEADVVIAKGQANFETLNPADREIFFLTQMKCPVIATRYGYNVGDWVVASSSGIQSRSSGT